MDEMVGLFPKLHLGQFAVIPAISHNSVLRGRCAG